VYYPPRLEANQTAYISDERYLAEKGASRFGAYSQECVLYWPWLSWASIDTAVMETPQSAIPRATLIGQPPTSLFAIVPDGTGAIARFGREVGGQTWECVAYFDWYNNDGSKKFASSWWTLWHPSEVTPPAPVEVDGGLDWASAPALELGVNYEANLVGSSNPMEHFVYPELSGLVTVVTKLDPTSGPVSIHVDYGAPDAPAYSGTYAGGTTFNLQVSPPGLGLRIVPPAPPDYKWIQFLTHAALR